MASTCMSAAWEEIKADMGFPGGAVVEFACQCRGHGFEPWSRKFPHATEQLSPCATTTGPAL